MHGPGAVMIKRALLAQRDDRRPRPHRPQSPGRHQRLVNRGDRKPTQRLRLALVRGNIVAKGQHPLRQARRRGRVQDRHHPRRPGEFQRMQRHRDRLFQLGHEHPRAAYQPRVGVNIPGGNLGRSPGRYDDGIVPRRILDKDIGSAGITACILPNCRMHPGAGPRRQRHVGKGVQPQPADEMRLGPRHRGGNRLVRSLATRPQHKTAPHDRLAHLGLTCGAVGRISHKHAQNHHSAHLKPPAGSRPCER